MNYVDIGVFLRILRDELHISQEDAAEVIGISDRTIRNIENGVTETDMVTLFKFCDFYGISRYEICLFYDRDPAMDQAIRDYYARASQKRRQSRKAHRPKEVLAV